MLRQIMAVALAVAALPACVARPAPAAVPPPDRMAAQVTVSGRTSTAVKVDVAFAGQEIPRTFSGDRVKNTPGFAWWVSRHWALKTDYPEEKARFYLTLLELAYPHFVELFGREAPGLAERRMTACYASSRERLREAMASDGITWNFAGGGITYDGYNCSYVYPSGTLEYHQRYILLHEAAHLVQTLLWGSVFSTPAWYYEGSADSLASHVYDSTGRRLTVHVLDKPTTHDYLDEGLAELARKPLTAENLHDGAGGRGANFLFVHFLSDDPDRAQKLRLWRDALPRLAARDRCLAESSRLMQDLYGPWNRINADFKAWLAGARNTFHYAEWGWEQDGDTLWSYGFAPGGRLSETDVLLPPGEKPAFSPLRMDWPAGKMSPLVGPVARGAAEPAVGCLIDFSLNPGKGRAGLGLGVIGGGPASGEPQPEAAATGGVRVITILPSAKAPDPAAGCLALLVNEERELVLDGAAVGMPRRAADLPKGLRDALAAGGHQVGMTVQIKAGTLEVTLRARDPRAAEAVSTRVVWPLPAEVRRRLLERPAAVLSRDGRHGVTPYFDDPRLPEPDLSVAAPPNRWRNPGDRPLAALYRAAWQLKAKAPESLVRLKGEMLKAATGTRKQQEEGLSAFFRHLAAVIEDVEACGAAKDVVREVAADLTAAGSA
jgi:hypothetical protein